MYVDQAADCSTRNLLHQGINILITHSQHHYVTWEDAISDWPFSPLHSRLSPSRSCCCCCRRRRRPPPPPAVPGMAGCRPAALAHVACTHMCTCVVPDVPAATPACSRPERWTAAVPWSVESAGRPLAVTVAHWDNARRRSHLSATPRWGRRGAGLRFPVVSRLRLRHHAVVSGRTSPVPVHSSICRLGHGPLG